MNDLSWIENLARQEIADQFARDVLDLPIEGIVAQATEECLQYLYKSFSSVVSVYNSKIHSQTAKIYRVSNTSADFVLVRKHLKLVFSNKSFGQIHIFFTNYLDQYIVQNEPEYRVILKAVLGPFNEVKWQHEEELVNLEHLIRYFSTAFIKQSA